MSRHVPSIPLSYAEGSPERARVEHALEHLCVKVQTHVPILIGGREVAGTEVMPVHAPHQHALNLGDVQWADAVLAERAAEAAVNAGKHWAQVPAAERSAVFLKAAELARDSWRATLVAACMAGHSKSVMAAERDAACSVMDACRSLARMVPAVESGDGVGGRWKASVEARPGFVMAVTPFASVGQAVFTMAAPLLAGNAVVWKPSRRATYMSHFIYRVLREAGLPDGVLNLVPGPSERVLPPLLMHPALSAVSFAGNAVGYQGIRSQTRAEVVGNPAQGGVLVAHPDCDVMTLAAACVRGAFWFQGQDAQALTAALIPQSLHDLFRPTLARLLREVRYGDVTQVQHYGGGLADAHALKAFQARLEALRSHPETRIIHGGKTVDSPGYVAEPTVALTSRLTALAMKRDAPGPCLTLCVYPDDDLVSATAQVADAGPWASVSLFARQRTHMDTLCRELAPHTTTTYIHEAPQGWRPPLGSAGLAAKVAAFGRMNEVEENFDPPMHHGQSALSLHG